MFLATADRQSRKNRFAEILLAAAIVVPLTIGIASHLNIGLRHIFIAIPALYIWISRIGATKLGAPIVSAAAASMVIIQISTAPTFLPYSNIAAGGSSKTYHLLTDSNVDWSQDMNRVGHYARDNHIKGMRVCMYVDTGSANNGLFLDCDLAHTADKHGYWAVSTTFMNYFGYAENGWRVAGQKPIETIGNAMLVYKLP